MSFLLLWNENAKQRPRSSLDNRRQNKRAALEREPEKKHSAVSGMKAELAVELETQS